MNAIPKTKVNICKRLWTGNPCCLFILRLAIIKNLGLKPRPSRTAKHVTIRGSADFGEKPKKQIQEESIGNTRH